MQSKQVTDIWLKITLDIEQYKVISEKKKKYKTITIEQEKLKSLYQINHSIWKKNRLLT